MANLAEVPASPAKTCAEGNAGRWTKPEHKRFLEALNLYKKDWKKVQSYVGTRTTTQVRSHAQKYFAKLAAKGLSPPSFDQQESLEEAEQVKAKSTEPAETKAKKRLKGPYSPGKKRIRCDEQNVPQEPPKAVRKKKKVCTCPIEWAELDDKSLNLLSTIREEKVNNSEVDFDMESVNVQPLHLESVNETLLGFSNEGDDYNAIRAGLVNGLIL